MKRTICILLVALLLCATTGCSDSSTNDITDEVVEEIEEETEAETEAVVYPFEIFNAEDTSFGNLKRMTVYASITKDYYESCDDATLGLIAEQAALAFAAHNRLNAFDVCIYVDEDIIGINGVDHTTFVAHTIYAPYGDFSRAGEVQAGDYSTFEFKTEITRTIRDAMMED